MRNEFSATCDPRLYVSDASLLKTSFLFATGVNVRYILRWTKRSQKTVSNVSLFDRRGVNATFMRPDLENGASDQAFPFSVRRKRGRSKTSGFCFKTMEIKIKHWRCDWIPSSAALSRSTDCRLGFEIIMWIRNNLETSVRQMCV